MYVCTRESGCGPRIDINIYPVWRAQILDAPLNLGEFFIPTFHYSPGTNATYSLTFSVFSNVTSSTVDQNFNVNVPSSPSDPEPFPPHNPANGVYTYFNPDNAAAIAWYFAGSSTGNPIWMWLLTCERGQSLVNCTNVNKTLLGINGPYNGDMVVTTTPDLIFFAYEDYCSIGGTQPVTPLTCPGTGARTNAEMINVVVVNRTNLSLRSKILDLPQASDSYSRANHQSPYAHLLSVMFLWLVIVRINT